MLLSQLPTSLCLSFCLCFLCCKTPCKDVIIFFVKASIINKHTFFLHCPTVHINLLTTLFLCFFTGQPNGSDGGDKSSL